jgi:hypothetical protein
MNEEQRLVLQTFQQNLNNLITEKFKAHINDYVPQLSKSVVADGEFAGTANNSTVVLN